jgi:hypothetical protein
MGHSWAIQIGPGVTFTPLKEPDVLVDPTHPSSADSYAMPCAPSQAQRACICPHTDSSKYPGTFPLSAQPYVQCRPICHVVCPISGPCAMRPMSAHWPVRATARVGPDTICNTLPTKAAPPSPFVGASTRTHSTLLTLSSPLRVKGLTRGWYGWWTKAYKLAPPLLK